MTKSMKKIKFDNVRINLKTLVFDDGPTSIHYTKIGKVSGIDTYSELIIEASEGGIYADSKILSKQDFLEKIDKLTSDFEVSKDQMELIRDFVH